MSSGTRVLGPVNVADGSERASWRSTARRFSRLSFFAWTLVVCGGLLFGVLPRTGEAAARTQSGEAAREYKLGKGHYDLGLTDRAISHFERVRALSADSSAGVTAAQKEQVLFLLGECYFVAGTLDRAGERYLELTRLYPDSTHRGDAWVRAAECWVKLDRSQDAIAVVEQLLSDPKLAASPEWGAPALFWSGEAHSRMNEPVEARARYTRLTSSFPSHELASFARFNLAGLLRADGQNAEALSQIEAMSVVPDVLAEPVRLLEGDAALTLEQFDRAASAYSKVTTEARRGAALEGMARAARGSGQRDALLSTQLELAHRFPLTPERRRVDLLCGAWAAEDGDVEQADGFLMIHDPIEMADSAVPANWGDTLGAEARFWRGWARGAAGDPDAAIKVYRPLLGEDGEWASWALFRTAAELRRVSRWEDGRTAALGFVSKHGEDPRVPEAMAGAVECSYRLGDHDQVLTLAQSFDRDYAGHPLRVEVIRFKCESAVATEEWDDAIAGYESLLGQLSIDEDRGAVLAAESLPRLAWARYQRDGAASAEPLAVIVSQLDSLENSTPAARAEVGLLLGHAHLLANDADAAILAFERASSADASGSAGARAALEAASARTRMGSDPAEIIAGYESAIARTEGPNQARAHLELAEYLVSLDRDAEATPQFQAFLAGAPPAADIPFALLALAFCQWREGEMAPAKETLEKLEQFHADRDDNTSPAGVEVLGDAKFLEGQVAKGLGNTDEAQSAWTQYLGAFGGGPREPEILRELARLAEADDDSGRAIEYLTQRDRDYPVAPGADESLYRLAWLQQESQQPDLAKKSYESLKQRFPESSLIGDVEYRLGDLAYQAGSYDEARQRYRASIQSPEGERLGEFARYRIAWSFQREENWSEAQAAFVSVSDSHPDGKLGLESLFLAAEAAGQQAVATGDVKFTAQERSLLERFLANANNHEYVPDAAVRLAELVTRDRDWAQVRTLLEPLLSRELEKVLLARHRVALGRALRESGAAKSAIRYLEEALAEGEAIAAEAQFEIGLCHRSLGDRKQAISVFTSGPILYPFKPWALRSYLEAARDMVAEGSNVEAKRLLERAIEQDDGGPWGQAARQLLTKIEGEGRR